MKQSQQVACLAEVRNQEEQILAAAYHQVEEQSRVAQSLEGHCNRRHLEEVWQVHRPRQEEGLAVCEGQVELHIHQ